MSTAHIEKTNVIITDEQSRWQADGGTTYALALLRQHPEMSLGTVVTAPEVLGGDLPRVTQPVRHFAHDGEFAYDNFGKHPIPEVGSVMVGGGVVVARRLDENVNRFYGYAPTGDALIEEAMADALVHIVTHGIVD